MKKCQQCSKEIEDTSEKCKHCNTDLRNWFVRHPIVSVLLGIAIIANLGRAINGAPPEESNIEIALPKVSRCEEVPLVVVSNLEDGLNIQGGGSLKGAKAVKSNEFSSVYFVSADLDGLGLEGTNDIATFAVNSLDGTGLMFSVSNVAGAFSDWGSGENTDAHLTMRSDGAQESQDCVNKR
ncbi:hypothetical protein HZA38_05040 [Candidatus Peregrinibacteria bacterium]|nr:hypothetical protein [Candidatus Peregrinibacteria bacterium]